MGYQDSILWKKLQDNCKDDRELGNIRDMCDRAIVLVKTIRDTFPDYTLHDEMHICNVIKWMEQILDDSGIEKLSDGECATLILAACYHDIGMCYTEEHRNRELRSHYFTDYLEKNPKAYLSVKRSREAGREIPREIQIEYFRSRHPQRVDELLPEKWEINLVRRDTLAVICKSHGEKIDDRKDQLLYDEYLETDHIMCAILLRLADVLDFDMSRAPQDLYEFQKIDTTGNPSAGTEWKKHQGSRGFRFTPEHKRLVYRAVCDNMQDEYTIIKFLDYVDEELRTCRSKIKQYGHTRWQGIEIPERTERYIERRGYQSGEYHLTLEADNVLDLLVGDGLYSEDVTFIRELMQNALDAVRARRMIDSRYNWEEKNQIVLSDWIDERGDQWFRIDDFGIGMDENTILNYFLRVGRSYYQSDEFRKLMYDNKSHYDFAPISRFGIGILSCFLKGDQMEVSTRHYSSGKGVRFSMQGTRGYYNLAAEEKGDRGTPMPCIDTDETENFRQAVGTSIAVRINESLLESIGSSIKSYLCYPDISVCYKNGTESNTFPTERELMEFVRKTKELRIPFPEEVLCELNMKMPQIIWEETPAICMKCVPLDELSGSSFISGADFKIDIAGKYKLLRTVEINGVEIRLNLVKRMAVTRSAIRVQLVYESVCSSRNAVMELSEFALQYRDRNDMVRRYADKFDRNEKLEDVLKEISSEDQKIEIREIYENLETFSEILNLDGVHLETFIPFSMDDDLKEAMEKYILPRCDSGAQYIDNNRIDEVYNGICIKKTWQNSYGLEESWFEYTVLLLSGDFCPMLGISRESVRYFPVKAAGYIELTGMQISNGGLSCKYPAFYRNMEYGEFAELLDDVEFCSKAERMLECKYGVSIQDMKERVASSSGKNEIQITDFDDIFDSYGFERPSYYFLNIFQRVLLQKEFDICWDLNQNGAMEYYITGIRKTSISETEKVFLPLTFVPSSGRNPECLTYAHSIGRCTLNASHPFSVWLMKEAEFLSKRHKSLWKKIRENICRLESEDMITEVNNFLREIQKRENISIPDDVWIKEDDFIEL